MRSRPSTTKAPCSRRPATLRSARRPSRRQRDRHVHARAGRGSRGERRAPPPGDRGGAGTDRRRDARHLFRAVESSTRPGSRQSRTPPSALTTSVRRSASERTSPHGSDPRGHARGIDGERAAAHLERGALARRGSAQWLALIVVAAAAIVADQVTKQVVGRTLALGDSVDIIGPFSIHHVQNSGIAFGLSPSQTARGPVTAVAVGLMLWFFARSGRRHPVLPVALRRRREHRQSDRPCTPRARDGLPRSRRPAFNLADTFIVVGVAILFGALVLADRSHRMHGARDGNSSLHRR